MGNCTTPMVETDESSNTCNSICDVENCQATKQDTSETRQVNEAFEWVPPSHGDKNVAKLFELQNVIGRGVSGVVYNAIYKGKKCAIKVISREDESSLLLAKSEMTLLYQLKHKGIIKLIDIYYDENNIYLIFEKGFIDLFDVIRMHSNDGMPEKYVVKVARKLFKTLYYLHKNNVVHRDLKPENIVFCKSSNGKDEPKIIDFGDAIKVENNKMYDDFVGTTAYMGKERYVSHKGWQLKKSDIFALGIICFEMMTQERCFNGETGKDIYNKVSNAQWKWPSHVKPSRECDHFIRWCLSVEARDRPSCKEALLHPWLNGKQLVIPAISNTSYVYTKNINHRHHHHNNNNNNNSNIMTLGYIVKHNSVTVRSTKNR